MERGPLALFGAILAVGLGPALWLGAQFGESTVTPQRPPAVTVQQNEVIPPAGGDETGGSGDGGTGAGDTPTDPAQIVANNPKKNAGPRKTRSEATPTASPSESASPSASEDADPSAKEPASSQSPPTGDDTSDPATPPTESTTNPAGDPTGGTSDEPTDPDISTPDGAAGDGVPAAYDPS